MGSGSLQQIIQAFNDVTGQDTTDWSKSTSQKLVDERIPEINWVEGVKEALIDLKAKGYQLGIVTSDTKKGVEQFLAHTNATSLFDLIILPKRMPMRSQILKYYRLYLSNIM